MGNKTSKTKIIGTTTTKIKTENNNYEEIKICSFYVNLSLSISLEEKIDAILELLLEDKYKIDVLCIHKIMNTDICKLIIKKIKELIEITKNNFYIYPSTNSLGIHLSNSLELTLSKSTEEIEETDILIISRSKILDSAKVVYDNNKIIYISNINIYNNIVSIYSFDLTSDKLGKSNKEIREREINSINNIINQNKRHIIDNSNEKNNNIHILCCSLNINELINKENNPEYINCMKMLNTLDIYRYIRTLKNIESTKLDSTNNKGKRSEYILFLIDNFNVIDNIEKIKTQIYDTYNCLLTNCVIVKDMKRNLDNYPVIATLNLLKLDKLSYNNTKLITFEID
jgi:hypothetical protein